MREPLICLAADDGYEQLVLATKKGHALKNARVLVAFRRQTVAGSWTKTRGR